MPEEPHCGPTEVELDVYNIFTDAINAAGEPLTLLCNDGVVREKAEIALAIAWAESGMNPTVADNINTGNCLKICPGCRFDCRNQDRGLFQINLCCQSTRLRDVGIITETEQLYDHRVNIKAALLISTRGLNWQPWSTWGAKSYLRFFPLPRSCRPGIL